MNPRKNFLSVILLAVTASAMGTPQEKLPMKLWYDRPANFFEESLPLGNGKLGALVYGGTTDNVIYLNDITLWTGQPIDRDAGKDKSAWIPKIREALYQENTRRPKNCKSMCRAERKPNTNHWPPCTSLIPTQRPLLPTTANLISTMPSVVTSTPVVA